MPHILRKLDAAHTRLLEEISPLNEETFARRPSEQEWSVAQIVTHLSLVEARVIKELELALRQEPRQLGILRRMIPTKIVAFRAFKVKAPKAVVPSGSSSKQETVNDFNEVRSRLKGLYEKHGEQRLAETVFRHPFLGEISGVATISFVAHHENRHHKQIREVIRKIKNA